MVGWGGGGWAGEQGGDNKMYGRDGEVNDGLDTQVRD